MFLSIFGHFYSGDKANWQDIELTTARPSIYHTPIIKNGVHSGEWEISDVAAYHDAVTDKLTAEIQQRLDVFAQTRNYDNALSCASYANSTVTKFATEAATMIELRDATWSTGYAILDDVLAGNRPVPDSVADIESELPVLTWGDEP